MKQAKYKSNQINIFVSIIITDQKSISESISNPSVSNHNQSNPLKVSNNQIINSE